MVRSLSLVLLLLAATPASAGPPVAPPVAPPPPPKLVLPLTVKTPVNFPATIVPSENGGGTIRWFIVDAGLQEYDLKQLLEPELVLQAKGRMFWAATQGSYRVMAVSAKDSVTSPIAVCTVIVGDAPTPPTPTPPAPPGPVPPTPPGPTPGPSPIPADGLRVLIVYDRTQLTQYPSNQVAALQAKDITDLLNANCAKGPDGVTAEWRVWDQSVDVTNEPKLWQDAFKRKRDTLPWIVIADGKTGFEGPLPKSVAETKALIQKYVPAKASPRGGATGPPDRGTKADAPAATPGAA